MSGLFLDLLLPSDDSANNHQAIRSCPHPVACRCHLRRLNRLKPWCPLLRVCKVKRRRIWLLAHRIDYVHRNFLCSSFEVTGRIRTTFRNKRLTTLCLYWAAKVTRNKGVYSASTINATLQTFSLTPVPARLHNCLQRQLMSPEHLPIQLPSLHGSNLVFLLFCSSSSEI
jgi:hypothetical protein